MECAACCAAGTADILTAQFWSWEGGEGGGWEKMMLNKGIKSLFFTSMLEMWGQVSMSALAIMFQM